MNAYQQKWLDVLQGANLKDWKIEARGEDIAIEMPHVTDLKLIRDNLPTTLGAISLDINLPHERLKFTFHNGYEHFEYVLNPNATDLNKED
jgi:predicted metalloenzyme YecM